MAVSNPVQNKICIRACFTFTPKLAAYISPSSKAFNGLISSTDNKSPVTETIEKKVIVP